MDVTLSKNLSWLLRHGAVKEGLHVGSDGFIDLKEVLAHSSLRQRKCTEEDILRIVAADKKGRYLLKPSAKDGQMRIKATQGHSFVVDDLSLVEITDPSALSRVVHGTYLRFWERIKVDGLKRMKRNHIHCTSSDFVPASEVKSGFRRDCELLIYLDTAKAMAAGIKFYLSENNVILTAGLDGGVIAPQFFEKVVHRKTGRLLYPVSITN